MENKQELKRILSEMLKGDLTSVKHFIKSKQNLTDKITTNILVTLCQLISTSKLRDKIPINDIKELIVWCCNEINNPCESGINNYLRSLFHVLKFLGNKMPLNELIQIYEYILPDWITPELSTSDVQDLYVHFSILLHNDIIYPNLKTHDIDNLVKCFYLSLKIHRFTFEKNSEMFFAKLNSYCTLLHKRDKFDQFAKFSPRVLKLLEGIKPIGNKETLKELYQSFICMIFVFFTNAKNNFSKNRDIVIDIFKMLDKLCGFDKDYKSYLDIFKLFFKLTVRNITDYRKTDLSDFINLNNSIEILFKSQNLNYSSSLTFNYICKMLRFLSEYFETLDKKLWMKHMDIDTQIQYVKLFQLISHILSKTEFTDNCSEKCLVKTDLTHACTIMNISGTLLNLSMKAELQNIEQLHNITLITLTDGCRYIEKLQNNNCDKWQNNWKILGIIIYNLASRFYRCNNFKISKMYYYLFCKYVIMFEGVENASICLENALGTSLHLMGLCYITLKQYRSAMTYLSVGIQVCPPLATRIWQSWCSVKAKANNDNVGNVAELTINQILQQDQDVIKQIHPTYIYKSVQMEELLSAELHSYNKIWPSKIPMNNTCKELCKNCTDPFVRTIALNVTSDKVICLQDEEFIENVLKTITVLNKKGRKNCLKSQLCLAVLYNIDFQFKSYDVLKRNLSEMNEAVREEKPIFKPYEEPPNPNDKCDIVPTYYNNKIENNLLLHKLLNKSVEILTDVFKNKEINTIKNFMEELNIDNLIKQAAYEYRLQNYSFQMLKTWFLYLEYGKLFANKEIIVTSIGFILESIDCSSDTALQLQKLAEKFINNKTNDLNFLEIVITYYINKSTGYMRSNILEIGCDELTKAEKYLKFIENDTSKVLEARIMFLKSLYLRKPCHMKLIDHDINYIVLAQNSFSTIAEFYKMKGSKCFYTLSILFEISLSNGWMYKWLRMPRETRCYTSESVLLAQQMVLPIWTVQFLSLLAFTDLLCCQYEDCKVKMSGIDFILGYRNHSKYNGSLLENQMKINDIARDFDKLSLTRNDNGIEMMLDVPIEHKSRNLQGSPILESKPFALPTFMYHVDCSCFYCVNIDYQKLILESTHLEALYHLRQCNLPCSSDFFKGGLKLYRNIIRKYDSLSKNDMSELINRFKKNLAFTYSKFLLDHSFYYAKKRDYDEALKVVDSILEILGNDVVLNEYFYSELLMHKINLFDAKELQNVKPTRNESNDELNVDYDVYLSKTPENKMSVAKISLSVSPCKDPSPQKPGRTIRFDIFGSDEEKGDKKSPNNKKYFKLKTPAKTPAPNLSKIKVYTPAHKIKNKIQPMAMALSPNVKNMKKNDIEKSPEAIEKSRKILESRTKLLTQKLKAEKLPVLKNSNSITNKKEIKKSETKKTMKENLYTNKIRKNIMQELSDTDTDVTGSTKTNTDKDKPKVKRQYTRITKPSSTSSEESVGRRNTRSVSKR